MALCYATEIELSDVHKLCQDAKARGFRPSCIYLHWSAGKYGQYFDDYHLMIDGDGSIQRPDDNDFDDTLPHTWHRNTNTIGLSFAACYDANPGNYGRDTDFGDYPIDDVMLDSMAKVIAVICEEFNLPIDYEHVKTHCEAAEEDDYGPRTTCERWDLWYLKDYDGLMKDGGDVLRGKALWWKNQGV